MLSRNFSIATLSGQNVKFVYDIIDRIRLKTKKEKFFSVTELLNRIKINIYNNKHTYMVKYVSLFWLAFFILLMKREFFS